MPRRVLPALLRRAERPVLGPRRRWWSCGETEGTGGEGEGAGVKSPYPYFGGKSKVAAEVWSRFGNVRTYVEPFFGSGAMLLARPTPFIGLETVNDKDHFIANFWRALKADPEGLAEACEWPINETDLHARHLWLVSEGAERIKKCYDDSEHFDLKVAAWWVWGISQWIATGWCVSPDQRRPALQGSGGGRHIWESRPHLTSKQGIYAPPPAQEKTAARASQTTRREL